MVYTSTDMYIYIHTYINISLYIYIERERDTCTHVGQQYGVTTISSTIVMSSDAGTRCTRRTAGT